MRQDQAAEFGDFEREIIALVGHVGLVLQLRLLPWFVITSLLHASQDQFSPDRGIRHDNDRLNIMPA